MRATMKLKVLVVAWAAIATGGCALTPRPEVPELIDTLRTRPQFIEAPTGAQAEPAVEAWWRRIGGDELDALVATLKADSLALQVVRLQALQAQENARLARGQRLPSVAAASDASATRTRGPGGEYSWNRMYTFGLLVDYNTDVFGGLRAAQRSAELGAIAADLSYRAAEQREIAALARSWISAATLKRRLALAHRITESFQSTYELTRQRYSAGSATASASDVQIARQNLDNALVDIPELETDLTQQLLRIDEQLGRPPGESEQTFRGTFFADEALTVPVGHPARLLASRPDVAAAELGYLAALEDVGAARAMLYPALSLGASLTFQADEPGELFDWDRHLLSLASSLTAPLFQGGRLRSQVRLQQARAQELSASFTQTALGAVIDVELALAEISGLDARRERLEAALATAEVSNKIAQGRYRQGLLPILTVLETQRSLNAAQQNLILTDQAIGNARVDLFLSLGGDWSTARSGSDVRPRGETPAEETDR